jgi:hypothetical protein
MSELIIIEPKSSDSGGRQVLGKFVPKTGVRAYLMCQQKVAATALAAS